MDRECITLNLKEKCFQMSVLKGYDAQKVKLYYPIPYLANLALFLAFISVLLAYIPKL